MSLRSLLAKNFHPGIGCLGGGKEGGGDDRFCNH